MIEGGAGAPGAARRVRAARRRRQRILGVAVAAVLAAGAFFGRQLLEPLTAPVAPDEAPAPPEPGRVEPPAPSGPPAAEAEPAPSEELPPLVESDAFVRERAARASTRPELAAWLAGEGLVERFVAAVDAVANGESPRAELRELAPQGPFRASERAGRSVADPSGGARYDLVSAVFASLDPQLCAALHRQLLPLFEAAYAELGRREGDFDEVLARAFRELLRAPVRDGEIELVPRLRSYRYADPALEALSPAQKQLLRMGPDNARRVQAKLRELAPALGLDIAAAARAPER
jgi:hypothetical protein